MKNILIKLFLGWVVIVPFAFAGGNASNGEALLKSLADAAKSNSCATCHGADGNSPSPAFPKLAGLGEKYLLKQLQDIKSETRAIVEMNGMLASFSDEQLSDIAAFYSSQKTQLSGAKSFKVTVNSGEEVDAVELGKRLYRAGNLDSKVPACTGCHSPRGLGNSPAGYPRLSGQHADYIAKQLKAFRAGQRTNDGESKVMRQVAEYMSDAEISAVSNYIAGLH